MTVDARMPVLMPTGWIRFTTVVSRAALFVAAFGLPLVMASLRIAESPSRPLSWLRLAVSLAAIAIVVFARRSSMARRVVLAFALEAACGIATLFYVDLPFVDAHAEQIAHAVAAEYGRHTHRDITSDLSALRSAP